MFGCHGVLSDEWKPNILFTMVEPKHVVTV